MARSDHLLFCCVLPFCGSVRTVPHSRRTTWFPRTRRAHRYRVYVRGPLLWPPPSTVTSQLFVSFAAADRLATLFHRSTTTATSPTPIPDTTAYGAESPGLLLRRIMRFSYLRACVKTRTRALHTQTQYNIHCHYYTQIDTHIALPRSTLCSSYIRPCIYIVLPTWPIRILHCSRASAFV